MYIPGGIFFAIFYLTLGFTVLTCLVGAYVARYALMFALICLAPLTITLGVLPPARWLSWSWLRGYVIVGLIAPVNALLMRAAALVYIAAGTDIGKENFAGLPAEPDRDARHPVAPDHARLRDRQVHLRLGDAGGAKGMGDHRRDRHRGRRRCGRPGGGRRGGSRCGRSRRRRWRRSRCRRRGCNGWRGRRSNRSDKFCGRRRCVHYIRRRRPGFAAAPRRPRMGHAIPAPAA